MLRFTAKENNRLMIPKIRSKMHELCSPKSRYSKKRNVWTEKYAKKKKKKKKKKRKLNLEKNIYISFRLRFD